MSDDNVTSLPVKFKKPVDPNDQPMLKVVHSNSNECNHDWKFVGGRTVDVQYLIREGETEIECGGCGAKLDPMFVLRKLAHKETRWHDARKRYADEMKRLSERSRTKCDHCGQMTRISR